MWQKTVLFPTSHSVYLLFPFLVFSFIGLLRLLVQCWLGLVREGPSIAFLILPGKHLVSHHKYHVNHRFLVDGLSQEEELAFCLLFAVMYFVKRFYSFISPFLFLILIIYFSPLFFLSLCTRILILLIFSKSQLLVLLGFLHWLPIISLISSPTFIIYLLVLNFHLICSSFSSCVRLRFRSLLTQISFFKCMPSML